MANELNGLKPQAIWKIFSEICKIPHPSKSEAAISEWVQNFAKGLKLETIVDETGNVIIRKPATPGMEKRMGIVLQGHLDMVPQKNNEMAHDFEKDPILPRIDGEWVSATGTTLGADNGIGVAAALAVMEATDLVHGPVECLFTIDEETGMTGAFGLKGGLLQADILMNLDSEDEGELYIGCAGGINAAIQFTYQEEAVPADFAAYNVIIKGLNGGHSGVDIHLGRANANKVLARFLVAAAGKHKVRVAGFEAGNLRNAIPREGNAVVLVPKAGEAAFAEFAKAFAGILKNEYQAVEPGLQFEVAKADAPAKVMDAKTQFNFLNAVYACPNGVISMIPDMPGVVQTSNNLAIVKMENGSIKINCLLRSSVESSKEDLAAMMEGVFLMAGAEVKFDGGYPGWKPNVNSPILKTMKEIYQKKFGKVPEVKVIHAGLECGLLGDVYKNWDMISFGPTIRYPHSPTEKVNIESVQKFWDYLVETLKNVPSK
jgi:dipeptidase D